ncbi:MAG: pilus assembly protein PilN, partial [Gammaproteobacteria bacterium]
MPRINLLPWREELRARKQKEFGIAAGIAALVMVAIIGAVHFQFNAMMEFQQSRNKYLEDQIAGLDKRIDEIKELEEKKKNLLARMEIIQQLQSSRPEVVHLFDELVTTLPDGVFFEKLTQK